MSAGKKQLLVIGYGFRDEHINAAIANGIEQSNLELFVVSPEDPADLKESLEGGPYGTTLRHALRGHYSYDLLRIFPEDQSDTQAWKEIRRTYFGEPG